jgi:(2R)-ethylmalonyl-CoA mutase
VSERNGKHRPAWIIRTYAGFGGAEETNRRFRENLARGQTGLSVAFDLPTQNGYDPDAPMARGEVGGCGVSIAHLGDMQTLFDGIDLASVNTSMTINATAPFLLALYLVLAEERDVPWTKLRGTVQNDLLKEFVARGTNIFCPDTSLRLSSDLITFAAEKVPHWNPINVCGYHYMESGASPQQEAGYAFGNALLVLDAVRPKLSPDLFEKIVRRISFFINSGIELVPEICKIRAYTKLWTTLCEQEYGIRDIAFRAGCQVRSLTLPAAQPENNIIRIALEALPAILSANARVGALQLPGFREAVSLPDQMEQTLSLRTQQILMYETRIAEYPDIFEGNPAIESLTGQILQEALQTAMTIRRLGFSAAISAINSSLTEAMVERQRRIDTGEDVLVGVNMFHESSGLSDHLPPAPRTAQDASFEENRVAAILNWKKMRNPARFALAKERLESAIRNGANTMEATLEFARAGGTIGEWTSLIEVATSGRYNLPLHLDAAHGANGKSKTSHEVRVVLGKAGLDGHTNAIKLLALACRNAGMEVIFAGGKLTSTALVKAAIEEDADVLGISCLSGAHLQIASDILSLKKRLELSSLHIVFGGTIPKEDKRVMLEMGIDRVFAANDATIDEIVAEIGSLASSS